MLKMRTVTNENERESFAKIYGLEKEKGLNLYLAENRGEVLGVCFYRFIDEGMEILYADADDDDALFDGLIRAAMAALFDCEKDKVVFSKAIDRQTLQKYRFITGDELCIKSANVFFQTCKNCKN